MKKQTHNKIEGTPYFGPELIEETHEVTGYWQTHSDGSKTLMSHKRDLAAYHVATDRECAECGKRTGSRWRTICSECKDKKLAEEIAANADETFTPEPENMVFSWLFDRYFDDESEALEFLEEENEYNHTEYTMDEMLLCWCVRVGPPQYDVWDDPLHDDDDGDWWNDECDAALKKLNEALIKAVPKVLAPTKIPV